MTPTRGVEHQDKSLASSNDQLSKAASQQADRTAADAGGDTAAPETSKSNSGVPERFSTRCDAACAERLGAFKQPAALNLHN